MFYADLMFGRFRKPETAPETNAAARKPLPKQFIMQVLHIWDEIVPKFPAVWMHNNRDLFYRVAQKRILKEFGEATLVQGTGTAREDIFEYLLAEQDTQKCLSVIEWVFAELVATVRADTYINGSVMDDVRRGATELNERLRQHGIPFEFVQWVFLPTDESLLHSEATAPALLLLREPHLRGADEEFARAHQHFRNGAYGECVNECLKAFESTMKSICDKNGWPYDQSMTAAKLLAVCQKHRLFPSYLDSSLNALTQVLVNVATIRNSLSGHGQGVKRNEVTPPIARFVLTSTAANVVLLASFEQDLT